MHNPPLVQLIRYIAREASGLSTAWDICIYMRPSRIPAAQAEFAVQVASIEAITLLESSREVRTRVPFSAVYFSREPSPQNDLAKGHYWGTYPHLLSVPPVPV